LPPFHKLLRSWKGIESGCDKTARNRTAHGESSKEMEFEGGGGGGAPEVEEEDDDEVAVAAAAAVHEEEGVPGLLEVEAQADGLMAEAGKEEEKCCRSCCCCCVYFLRGRRKSKSKS
jgi:hypothetical protein